MATNPRALIEGYENNWGKLPKSNGILEHGLDFEKLRPEINKKLKEYHHEELIYDELVLSGKLEF